MVKMLMLGLRWSSYKFRMHVKRRKTILYEQKHLKNDDRPVAWKRKYGISFTNYDYTEKTHLKNKFSINSSKHK